MIKYLIGFGCLSVYYKIRFYKNNNFRYFEPIHSFEAFIKVLSMTKTFVIMKKSSFSLHLNTCMETFRKSSQHRPYLEIKQMQSHKHIMLLVKGRCFLIFLFTLFNTASPAAPHIPLWRRTLDRTRDCCDLGIVGDGPLPLLIKWNGTDYKARICKPFKAPKNRIESQPYDNPIWRTGPPGYIGWRNRSWAP